MSLTRAKRNANLHDEGMHSVILMIMNDTSIRIIAGRLGVAQLQSLLGTAYLKPNAIDDDVKFVVVYRGCAEVSNNLFHITAALKVQYLSIL